MASVSLFPLLFAQPSYADCVSPNQANTNAVQNPPVAPAEGETVVVTTQVTCGGDDVSYRVAVPSSITFDGVSYQAVYATTNSVITFGNPDGTYWTYPSTPSLSIGSQDWVAYPSQHPDEHFIITTSALGFQIDLAARPYANQNTPTLTTIITTAIINADTTLNITYLVDNLPDGTRTGARLPTGQIVTLEQAGVIQVEVAPPAPGEPTPAPIPEPVPIQTPEPAPIVVVVPQLTEEQLARRAIRQIQLEAEALARAQAELIPPAVEPEPPIEEELPLIPPEEIPLPVDETPVVVEPPIDIPIPPIEEPPIEDPLPSTPEPPPVEIVEPDPIPVVPVEPDPIPVVEVAPTIDEVVADAMADGVLIETETVAVVAALVASSDGAPISAKAVADAGLTYSDLPPATPVAVREDAQGNEVVITAEVAVALELLSSPSDLVTAIFTDPAQAVLAIASIGADMSEPERTESKHTVVATIIAAGAAINAVGAATGSTRTPSSGGGGAASSDSKGVRRRKP